MFDLTTLSPCKNIHLILKLLYETTFFYYYFFFITRIPLSFFKKYIKLKITISEKIDLCNV